MKFVIGLLMLALLAPGVSAECTDLAGQGTACAEADEGGADATLDVANEDAGVTVHGELHIGIG